MVGPPVGDDSEVPDDGVGGGPAAPVEELPADRPAAPDPSDKAAWAAIAEPTRCADSTDLRSPQPTPAADAGAALALTGCEAAAGTIAPVAIEGTGTGLTGTVTLSMA